MNTRRFAMAVLGAAWLCLGLAASACRAATPEETGRPVVERLLKAIQGNDYAAFVADADNHVKASLTKEMLEGVSGMFAPRLGKGYECTFLGELKQQGTQVQLWKLVFKDGGDDILAKLALKNNQVAGFLLQ